MMRKKNRGYICIDGVKEFLKLKPSFPDVEIPPKPVHLRAKFRELFAALNAIVQHSLGIKK